MLDAYLAAGLEQAGDTVLPRVELRTRLRALRGGRTAGDAAGSLRLVAHPAAGAPLGSGRQPAT
jgi:hypothetical protein